MYIYMMAVDLCFFLVAFFLIFLFSSFLLYRSTYREYGRLCEAWPACFGALGYRGSGVLGFLDFCFLFGPGMAWGHWSLNWMASDGVWDRMGPGAWRLWAALI